MYAVMLLVGVVVCCIMLSPGLQDTLAGVPFCKNEDSTSLGFKCSEVVGYLAVYRVCFALTCFFSLMAVLTIGVKTSKDPRAGIQNGFWGIKYLIIIGICVGGNPIHQLCLHKNLLRVNYIVLQICYPINNYVSNFLSDLKRSSSHADRSELLGCILE